MNWRSIRTLVMKDLRVVTRSKMILLPMIVVPVLLLVVIPGGMGAAVLFAGDAMAGEMDEVMQMLNAMPANVLAQFASMNDAETFLVLLLTYLFAPMYLIIPMMVSSVIAADSFVGERERKTLEALLHTPLTNRELLTAKILSAWVAALGVGLGAFVLYGVVANVVGWPIMGRLFFPNTMWLFLVLWVSPAVAGLGLGVTVLISTRVNTFQEAYQMGGIVVVPIVALVIAQAAGVMYLSSGLVIGLGAIIWIIDAIVLWFGVRTFDRDRLLARL